jgi:23S rRNA (cytidine1920-2'-O)/16S rRNA (cytidine1409-2'-O)-methyltransferase
MRLDVYLAECGKADSRSEAQRLIRSGAVRIGDQTCMQCARQVKDDDEIAVDRSSCRYVSRGGLKLEGALRTFGISPAGQVALDIGASSGGFTDCLLQHGAAFVYALENGSGQLAERLSARDDVVSMENRNARYISASDFEKTVTFVTMDVSFISQTLILPAVANVLSGGGQLITLIKPQFEVGRGAVGGGGIVRSEKARKAAVERVCDTARICGFEVRGITESPICGGDGNIEYLAYFTK